MSEKPKKLSTKYRYVRAVKNRLCRIEDDIKGVMLNAKLSEKYKKELLIAGLDIDNCVESLEKLMKLL